MRWANGRRLQQPRTGSARPDAAHDGFVGDTRLAIRFLIGSAALFFIGGVALVALTSALIPRALGVLLLFWAVGSGMGARRFLRGEA